MVRSLTFEIRWHDTEPIYSASFQPIDPPHLRRVLDHNKSQAQGKLPTSFSTTAPIADASTSASAAEASSTSSQELNVSAGAGPSTGASSSSHAAAARAAAALLPISAAGQSWRLATAGADKNARIWKIHPNIPSPAALASVAAVSGSGPVAAPHPPRIEYLATLSRHTGSVNVVRFCPHGEVLATAGDDGTVLFWVLSDQRQRHYGEAVDDAAQYEKEFWRVRLMTRATERGEIYDLSWAPNGDTLAVGSTDSITRIINAHDGSTIRQISEHALHVQGVAWDPLNEYLATQSSDRTVHVHSLQTTRSAAADGASMISITTHTASRNSRMDLHRRSNSGSGGVSGSLASLATSPSPAVGSSSGATPVTASALASGSSFVWDPQAKPPLQRRASSHSHASDGGQEREQKEREREGRSGRSNTPSSVIGAAGGAHSQSQSQSQSHSAVPPSAHGTSASSSGAVVASRTKAGTPTPSVPASPFSAASAYAMHPPHRTPSRRSSFSGSNADVDGPASPPTSATSLAPSSIVKHTSGHSESQVPSTSLSRPHVARATSASASHIRSARSPSPMPPLPAIRAPPSPRQQIRAAQSSRSQLAKVQLYGDQSFSGFFRRLCFSPDGSLLVTPAGIFDTPPTPTSPTVAVASSRKSSDGDVSSSSAAAAAAAVAMANSTPARSTVYLYARGNLHRSNAPIARLPAHKSASVVVRFSPILYQLRPTFGSASSPVPGETQPISGSGSVGMQPHTTIPLEVGREKTVSLLSTGADGTFAETSSSSAATAAAAAAAAAAAVGGSDVSSTSARAQSPFPTTASPRSVAMIGLPYRMIFAVATYDSVWIYDTQQSGAICCFSNMHYAAFTDLTWSPDGQTLIMSSTDGYCSVAVFDYGELGTPYQYSAQPSLQHLHGVGGVPPPATHAHGGAAPPPPAPAVISTPHVKSDAVSEVLAAEEKVAAALAGSESEDQPPKKRRRIAPTLLTTATSTMMGSGTSTSGSVE